MHSFLVIPGTLWQLSIIKKIKKMGFKAYVVNPTFNETINNIVDGFLLSDIFDLQKIYEFIAKNKIDAVISDECDIAMPLVSRIGKKFGFSVIPENITELYTNKYRMREFCIKNDMPCPEYILCSCSKDVIDFFSRIRSDIIIKPIDSNASHGVFKISNEKDITAHFDETISYSRKSKCVLAEKYVNGTEFTIDGIKTPKKHFTLAISEKKHFKHNSNIADELYFSHNNAYYDYEMLKKVNDKYVNQSALEFGFTHAEYKYENGKFFLIEIAARGGGNMISSVITQFMSGYDTYEYLINCHLGIIQDFNFTIKDSFRDRVAVLKFFDLSTTEGKVKKIFGLEYLASEPGIVSYKLNFGVGDLIKKARNDSERIGFYIACSESKKELNDIINNVNKKFYIELE